MALKDDVTKLERKVADLEGALAQKQRQAPEKPKPPPESERREKEILLRRIKTLEDTLDGLKREQGKAQDAAKKAADDKRVLEQRVDTLANKPPEQPKPSARPTTEAQQLAHRITVAEGALGTMKRDTERTIERLTKNHEVELKKLRRETEQQVKGVSDKTAREQGKLAGEIASQSRRDQQRGVTQVKQDFLPKNAETTARDGHRHPRTMLVGIEDPNTAALDNRGLLAEFGTPYWDNLLNTFWINDDGLRHWTPIGGSGAGGGPFCHDYLVDPEWAAKVAAGIGTEGMVVEPFHGHEFRVYSTLQAAVTHATTVITTAAKTILYCGGTTENVTYTSPGATANPLVIDGIAHSTIGSGAGVTVLTGNFTYSGSSGEGLILRDFHVTGTFTCSGIAPRLKMYRMDIVGKLTIGVGATDYAFYHSHFADIDIDWSSSGGGIHFIECTADDITNTGAVIAELLWHGGYITGSATLDEVNHLDIDTAFLGSGTPGYHLRWQGASSFDKVRIRGQFAALSSASAAKNYILLTTQNDVSREVSIDITCEIPSNTTNEIHYLRHDRLNATGTIYSLQCRIHCGENGSGEILEDLTGAWAAVRVEDCVDGTFLLTPCRSTVLVEGAASANNCIISGTPDASSVGVEDDLADHLADTADAHDASAISILDAAADFTATDVEGALAELQSDNEAHVAAADPHTGYLLESLLDALGDLIYASADNTPAKLAGQITTTRKFLRQTGDGAISAAPAWDTLLAADVPARTATFLLTAAAGSPTTTTPCTGPTQVEAGTNDVDYWVLDFPDSGADTMAFWGPIPMPDGYDGGTLTARFIWTAASGAGDVIFGIQMLSVANDEVIDAAYGTAVTVTDTLLATGDIHVSPTASAIEPAGSQAAGELMFIRVYRDGNNASDTLSGTARLIAVQIEFGSAYSD